MATDENPLIKLNLRLREDLRQRLEAAAEKSGRSLNSEIVVRLEDSLQLDEAHGGAEQAELLRAVARVMNVTSDAFGEPWWKRYGAWNLVYRSCYYLVRRYKPDPPPPLEKLMTDEGWSKVKKWNEDHSEAERERLEQENRLQDLRITTNALRDQYAAAKLLELAGELKPAAPAPDLDPSDLAI